MPEGTPELPVSEQEIQIQAPSLLDKIKIHKFKILGGVLGVFVLAGAVFGAYNLGQRQAQPAPGPTPTPVVVATPTPDPTTNWKTYTNTKYGYLVKYPADWVFQEIKYESTLGDTTPSFIGVGFRPAEPEPANEKFTVINIETLNNPDKLSLEDFFRKWDYRCCGSKAESTKLPSAVRTAEEIAVGGLQGKKIISPPIDTAGLPVTWVLIEQDNKIFRFRVTLDKSYPEINKERIFNLILSTFKFLEEEDTTPTPVPTPTLKTYKDQEIGYSLTYPLDWVFKKTYGKDIPKVGQTDVVNGIEIYKPNQPFTFVFNVIDKKDASSIIDWWNKYSPNRLSPEEKIDRPNFSFNGIDAVKRSGTPGGTPPSRVMDEIHFLWKDYIYFLSLSYSPYELNKELLDIVYSLELP